MIKCSRCGENPAAEIIGLCASCIRESVDIDAAVVHKASREKFRLPLIPPKDFEGLTCTICANKCSPGPGKKGFCGVRINQDGVLKPVVQKGYTLAHYYKDPLPTNCCASWFCKASEERGYNLAVFFYGCNLDCLFCQNYTHKNLQNAEVISMDDIVTGF